MTPLASAGFPHLGIGPTYQAEIPVAIMDQTYTVRIEGDGEEWWWHPDHPQPLGPLFYQSEQFDALAREAIRKAQEAAHAQAA